MLSAAAPRIVRVSCPTRKTIDLRYLLQRCRFSTTRRHRIMETTGFTSTQLEVREAISALCSKFPNSYWRERDDNANDPSDFHAALAKDGWLGIALPEAYGGSGLGISEATMMMQTISESGAGIAEPKLSTRMYMRHNR